MSFSKVAFIQGRPDAHPSHKRFAASVNADFHYVDFRMRWQDKEKSLAYRVISWFVCAITFPNRSNYNVFFVDNLHFMPVIMKSLRLINKRQKIVAHLGSHTLYFIYAHRFSKLTETMHIMALRRYDALICEGKMAEELVKKILGTKTPRIYTIINGPNKKFFPDEHAKQNPLSNKTILFVGHGTGEERMWYKGLDLMIKAFVLAKKKDPELTFTIVGEWEESVKNKLLNDLELQNRRAIHFEPETDQLEKYFNSSSLYLHCARGEAYGLTILIALAHGLPAIISEWTGAREVMEKINKSSIVQLNEVEIAKEINLYFSLSPAEKLALSKKGREVAFSYTEDAAVKCFQLKFQEMESDFNLMK